MRTKDLIIHDWMFRTGLKGNDLLLYAIIYDEEYLFATQGEVARLLGVTIPTAVKTLCTLMDRGLIEETIAQREFSHAKAYHVIDKETVKSKYV